MYQQEKDLRRVFALGISEAQLSSCSAASCPSPRNERLQTNAVTERRDFLGLLPNPLSLAGRDIKRQQSHVGDSRLEGGGGGEESFV